MPRSSASSSAARKKKRSNEQLEDAAVLLGLGDRRGQRLAEVVLPLPRHRLERRERVEDLRGARPPGPRGAARRRRRRLAGRGPGAGRQPAASTSSRGPAELHPDALGHQVHVGAVLDDDAHRPLEHRAVEVVGAEQQQGARPVDRLGDRGRLLEVELADHVDDLHQAPREPLVDLGRVQANDLHLALDLRVVEPQVEAAPLQRLGQLARVVRGQHDDRMGARLDHAQLRDRDLEVRQDLEQHRLELLVGLVDLVDQQHDRLGGGDRLQQRPGEQELLGEDVAHRRAGRSASSRVRVVPGRRQAPLGRGLGLDAQQLLAVVPLVQRLGLVEALVALQADQLALGGPGERLRQLGLSHSRGSLDEDGLSEPLREVGDQRRGLVGEVSDPPQRLLDVGDGAGLWCRRAPSR